MSMKSTFPLIAFGGSYTFALDLTINSQQVEISVDEGGIQVYGTDSSGNARAGTLLAEIESSIDTALSPLFSSYVGATATWIHASSSSTLLWSIQIDIGESVTGTPVIEEASGDLRNIGLYLDGGSLDGVVDGNTATFTSQFTPSGVWAPCMPNELRSPDREYVLKMARNPRSPANFSRIQHAQTTYQNVTWTDVSGFYRDSFRRSQEHYQDQAGFDLPGSPGVPTLETLLDSWVGGVDLQLWTDLGDYLDVDLVNRDTFRVSSLASEGSAGGSRFTVEMEFVEV